MNTIHALEIEPYTEFEQTLMFSTKKHTSICLNIIYVYGYKSQLQGKVSTIRRKASAQFVSVAGHHWM